MIKKAEKKNKENQGGSAISIFFLTVMAFSVSCDCVFVEA